MMAYSTAKSNRCFAYSAVACTSAHNSLILDTALAAVSILLALIISVLRT